mmetsp:Transcript_7435/g.14104  ORF Transcript_7435/g.14104 Transcript_7435/m.14104 type:complete len:201 (-) Transcript_7435:1197-1799(-)
MPECVGCTAPFGIVRLQHPFSVHTVIHIHVLLWPPIVPCIFSSNCPSSPLSTCSSFLSVFLSMCLFLHLLIYRFIHPSNSFIRYRSMLPSVFHLRSNSSFFSFEYSIAIYLSIYNEGTEGRLHWTRHMSPSIQGHDAYPPGGKQCQLCHKLSSFTACCRSCTQSDTSSIGSEHRYLYIDMFQSSFTHVNIYRSMYRCTNR